MPLGERGVSNLKTRGGIHNGTRWYQSHAKKNGARSVLNPLSPISDWLEKSGDSSGARYLEQRQREHSPSAVLKARSPLQTSVPLPLFQFKPSLQPPNSVPGTNSSSPFTQSEHLSRTIQTTSDRHSKSFRAITAVSSRASTESSLHSHASPFALQTLVVRIVLTPDTP